MATAGADMAGAGTGRVDVVVVDVVVPAEATVLRPRDKGSCAVGNGLGGRRGRA